MDYEFESIIPWNGEHDTGRDARQKLDRNFAKIKANFQELGGAKFVTVDFFARIFGLDGEDGAEVDVNDMEAVITAVKVKFGLYSEGFVSALDKNPDSGATPGGATTLAALTDVSITATPQDKQVLAWSATLNKWTPIDMEATAGIDEAQLEQILTDKGYATQQWVTGQLAGYVPTSRRIIAGTGLTGGGALTANVTLSLATVGTAGTYTKVTVDQYGRVTGHQSLAAADIPALSISKITGLQAELNSKLDVNVFEELFEKVYVSGYGYAIRAKLAFYSEGWISTKGQNPDAGSATGGVDENEVLQIVAGAGYATQSWVTGQGYALKTTRVIAGAGLTGGGTLAADRTLALATVGTAGTYTKVTVDAYGRVTGHGSLAAGDIPALAISKITGLQAALDAKMDAADKSDFMRFVDIVTTDSDTLYSAIGIRSFSGCYPDSLPAGMRWHNYGEAISFPVPNGMRFDLYANHHSSSSLSTYNRNGLMFRTGFHNNTINGWRMLLDGTNYNGYVTTLDNLTHAVASDYIQVGSARLRYDSANNALYVQKSDGTQCGFYATGFVSTKGANSDAGSVAGGSSTLAGLTDVSLGSLSAGQILSWNGSKWTNAAKPASTWNEITGKPSWIGSTKPTYSFSEILNKPTTIAGYGITDAYTKTEADGRYFRSRLDWIESTTTDSYDLWGNGIYLNATGNVGTNSTFPSTYGILLNFAYYDNNFRLQLHATDNDIRYNYKFDNINVTNWKVLLNSTNYTTYTVTKTGGGASGTWAIGISGNAASATKLQTARTLWGQTFDGTANVSGNLGSVGNISLISNYAYDCGSFGAQWDNVYSRAYHIGQARGTNYISEGNGDNATYDTFNLKIHAHWGIGIVGNENVCRMFIDARTGSLSMKGNLTVAGTATFNSQSVHNYGILTSMIKINQYLEIGNGRLYWDSTNNALYVQKSDGTACGFYATGFLSAKGGNPDAGATAGGSGNYVSRDGDTMTGLLTISTSGNQQLYLDGTSQAQVAYRVNGVNRALTGYSNTSGAFVQCGSNWINIPTSGGVYYNNQ